MNKTKIGTTLLHTASSHDIKKEEGRVSVPQNIPLYLSSVYAFDTVDDYELLISGKTDSFAYARSNTPNTQAVEEIMTNIEHGEAALSFSSGMSAIVSTILSFVKAGDHIVSSPVIYGATWDFFENELKKYGIEVTFANFNADDLESAIRPNTKLLYTETIANPTMEVADIPYASKIAKLHNLKLIVDNTFATPVFVNVLDLGADIVLYSATKYLSGHSDLVGGVVVGNKTDVLSIKRTRTLFGGIMEPFTAWLLTRSLRTLELRTFRQCENAKEIANYLYNHPKVKRTFYPGLESSPSYDLANKLFLNHLYGGMISFDLEDGASAEKFIANLDYIKFAPSLAGIETTISYPVKTSHRAFSKAQLEKASISDGTLRLSVGAENVEDIINEIDVALQKL